MAWSRRPRRIFAARPLRRVLTISRSFRWKRGQRVCSQTRFHDGCAEAGKRRERPLDHVARKPSDDEDDARTAIVIGPFRQMIGRMHEMLDAVDYHRTVVAGTFNSPLTRNISVPWLCNSMAEPDAESGPVQRPLETQAESMDASVMPIDIRRWRWGAGRHPPAALDGKPATALPRPCLRDHRDRG